jgi:hypothetical protein
MSSALKSTSISNGITTGNLSTTSISTTGGTWITGTGIGTGIVTGIVTGTINTGTTLQVNGGWNTIASTYTGSLSRKYKVLGTEIEARHSDMNFDLALASINYLGVGYYIQLKENSHTMILSYFPSEIIEFLDKEVIAYNRHEAIEKILN